MSLLKFIKACEGGQFKEGNDCARGGGGGSLDGAKAQSLHLAHSQAADKLRHKAEKLARDMDHPIAQHAANAAAKYQAATTKYQRNWQGKEGKENAAAMQRAADKAHSAYREAEDGRNDDGDYDGPQKKGTGSESGLDYGGPVKKSLTSFIKNCGTGAGGFEAGQLKGKK